VECLSQICRYVERLSGETDLKFKCEACGREIEDKNNDIVIGLDEVECSECQGRMGISGHQIQSVSFCHPPCGVQRNAKPYQFSWDVTNHLKVLELSPNTETWYYLDEVAHHVTESEYETWSAERRRETKYKPFVPDNFFFKTEADGVFRASNFVLSNITPNQLAEVADILYDMGKARPILNLPENPVEIVDCVVKIKDKLKDSKIPRFYWHDIILTNMMTRYEAPFYAKEVPVWLEEPMTVIEKGAGGRKIDYPPMTGHIDVLGGEKGAVYIYDYKPRETGIDRGYNFVYYAPQLCAYAVMLLDRIPSLAKMVEQGLAELKLGIFDETKLVVFGFDVIYELQGFFGGAVMGIKALSPVGGGRTFRSVFGE
jgi:DNA-directed RNA polymerase subunit RPC12/RpoP